MHTLEQYADDHGKIMAQVADLNLVSLDVFFAKGDRVRLRYTAEGSHCGEPRGDIPPTGCKAKWTAAAIFRVDRGKLVEFIKSRERVPPDRSRSGARRPLPYGVRSETLRTTP
jgi:hypothetical protein